VRDAVRGALASEAAEYGPLPHDRARAYLDETGEDRTLPPRFPGQTLGSRMDALALILAIAALIMFVFAASGRELRRFNEIALGLVFLTAALICQFTSITHTHIGR